MQFDILKLKKDKDFRIKKLPPFIKEGITPRDFQHRAILMLYLVNKVALAYDVGLGKTFICLTSFSFIRHKKSHGQSHLFVFTTSSALYQWKEETSRFTTFNPVVVDGKLRNKCFGRVTKQSIREGLKSQGFKDKDLEVKTNLEWRFYKHKCLIKFYSEVVSKYDVIIMTYEMMRIDHNYISKLLPDSTVVWDEVLKLKNRKSKLYICAEAMAKVAPRLIAATATLLKGNLEEVWNIFGLLVPEVMPSEARFINQFCIRKEIRAGRKKIMQTVDYHNLKDFREIIQPYFISCKKKDVPDHLPEIEMYPMYCDLTPGQKELYRRAYEEVLDVDEEKDAVLAVTRILRCQQIVNYPSVLGYTTPSSKEALLLELITEDEDFIKDKSVIFTRFKTGVERLVEVLDKYKPVYIHGELNPGQRKEAMDIFNTSKDRNIIVINSAASSAINLQQAANLIQYDMDWTYGENHQVMGRINRLNSVHAINRMYQLMVSDSIDEYVYHKVIRGQGYSDELFDNNGYTIDPNGLKLFIKSFKDFHKKHRPY